MNPNVGFMYLFRFCSNKFEFVSAVSSYMSVPAADGGPAFPSSRERAAAGRTWRSRAGDRKPLPDGPANPIAAEIW